MLPTGDPLGTVVTMLATPFGRLDGLAIDSAGAGGWLPTGSPPDSTSEGIIHRLPGSVVSTPQSSCRRSSRWKIVRQRAPDTAIAVAVEDGIDHGPHSVFRGRPPVRAGGRGASGHTIAGLWITGVWLGFIPCLLETPLLEQTSKEISPGWMIMLSVPGDLRVAAQGRTQAFPAMLANFRGLVLT